LEGIPAEVLLVDNASSDATVEAVQKSFPSMRVISNPINAGFGAANNFALRIAQGRYFLFLNTDAFPKPSAVAVLIAFLDHHPDIGVVGPRLLNPDGSLQTSCYRYPTPALAWLENLGLTKLFSDQSPFGNYESWDHSSPRDVDFVIGACLLLRREVYDQIGGFDESFFMYQEEADWQRRIRSAGWRIVFTPSAEVEHLGGASGKAQALRTNEHFFRSLDIYILKHHGWVGFILVRGAMLAGCAWRAIAWALLAVAPKSRAPASRRARFYGWLFQRQLLMGPPPGKNL
jgi:GT2 family glycosyltransferase